jgi:N-acetylglutamate synthase-like GNAT family acetyltransferase
LAALTSTSDFCIRLATIDDLDAIIEVEASATEAFLVTEHADAPDPPLTNLCDYRRLIAAAWVWVAELDGAVVGSLIAEVMHDALHLRELAVRMSHQRHGIGRSLVQTALAAAHAHRLPAVTLTTFRGVAFNAPFYRSLGFAILEQPPSRLRALLESEAAQGLRDRCAMRLTLPQPAVR